MTIMRRWLLIQAETEREAAAHAETAAERRDHLRLARAFAAQAVLQ